MDSLKLIQNEEDLGRLLNQTKLDLPSEQQSLFFKKIGIKGDEIDTPSIQVIGELERKKQSLWSIKLKNGDRIFLTLKVQKNKAWKIDSIRPLSMETASLESILTPENTKQQDSMMVAHSFVSFSLQKDFSKAQQLVDKTKLSDVRLASLCILFDDGNYSLIATRGVLTQLAKPTVASYSIQVMSEAGEITTFSLLLSRDRETSPWKVEEVNFSSLLTSYIKLHKDKRYYSPFIKNPKGGDSIVVYFDFDQSVLTPRDKKQLDLIANILKLDTQRKISLTGHTDAIGKKSYNRKLSQGRAKVVRDFLVEQGVKKDQIKATGYGPRRPREANTHADGTDNPEGRRANRRTEIYLDF